MTFRSKLKYIISGIFLIVAIAVLYFKDNGESKDLAYRLAKHEAKVSYNKDIAYRRWASMHGGVYVPVDSITPPNPYLSFIKERDVITQSGRKLTLMNPAYMTRKVHELFSA
jgi:hypothetical protein